jgi:hypothetical protein
VDYTPIHRLLGVAPAPLTSSLLGDAVAAQLPETRDLDWKRSLPAEPGRSDFPKDVAAMANSGGGMIVYGVTESNKRAHGRYDIGEVSEQVERTLRAVAAAKVSPPVLNLRIERIGAEGEPSAVAVIVPPSSTPPHLIFDNQGFRAPVRNDADTIWMNEPQLAAAFKERFDAQRDAEVELDHLYEWARLRSRPKERAWLVAVARPRVHPPLNARLSVEAARAILQAGQRAAANIRRDGLSVFRLLDVGAPRPGLRRQVFRTPYGGSGFRDARVSIHDRGSITLDIALGGAPTESGREEPGGKIAADQIECAIVDFVCAVQASAEHHGWGDFDIEVGVEWKGEGPLQIIARDQYGFENPHWSTPLDSFESIRSSLSFVGDPSSLEPQARELALDVINQAGLQFTSGFLTPDPD